MLQARWPSHTCSPDLNGVEKQKLESETWNRIQKAVATLIRTQSEPFSRAPHGHFRPGTGNNPCSSAFEEPPWFAYGCDGDCDEDDPPQTNKQRVAIATLMSPWAVHHSAAIGGEMIIQIGIGIGIETFAVRSCWFRCSWGWVSLLYIYTCILSFAPGVLPRFARCQKQSSRHTLDTKRCVTLRERIHHHRDHQKDPWPGPRAR